MLDAFDRPHDGGVLSRFEPANRFLPYARQLCQVALRNSQRGSLLEYRTRNRRLSVRRGRPVSACIGGQ
jgi:hypothetical protein